MTETQLQEVQIVDDVGAPPELIRIAYKAARECTKVKKIIFSTFIKELSGDLGAYDPENETITIDMGSCVVKKAWMTRGILYIPNVWFNLLFTFFHETAHAFQLEEDPGIIVLDTLPQEYEDEANQIAEDSLLEWAKGNTIPKLNELGWVGTQIKSMLNKLYVQLPDAVNEEMEVEGTEAVANALHAMLTIEDTEDAGSRKKVLASIDQGDIGVKVAGKRYLTAYEAINTIQEGHYQGGNNDK